jgi:energy-coupling factor transporter ATP-binding protein EcfA2
LPLIDLRDVTIWTPEGKRILDSVTWQVEAGEHWVILGPNGAGKTTLMSVVGADRHPSQGTAALLGRNGRQHGHASLALADRPGRSRRRALDWLNGRGTGPHRPEKHRLAPLGRLGWLGICRR